LPNPTRIEDRKWPPLTIHQLERRKDTVGRLRCRVPDALDHPLAGRVVCGRLKREKRRLIPDEACLQRAMPNGACHKHGGPSPGAPKTANGRYSIEQKRWNEVYQRSIESENALDVRPDLALMDAAIQRRLELLAEEDAPAWRAALRKAYKSLRRAMRAGNKRDMGTAIGKLGELIDRGASIENAVEGLVADVDKRAARAHKEREVQMRSDEVVTQHELMRTLSEFLVIVKRHAPPDAVRAMVPEFRTAIGAVPLLEERNRNEGSEDDP